MKSKKQEEEVGIHDLYINGRPMEKYVEESHGHLEMYGIKGKRN